MNNLINLGHQLDELARSMGWDESAPVDIQQPAEPVRHLAPHSEVEAYAYRCCSAWERPSAFVRGWRTAEAWHDIGPEVGSIRRRKVIERAVIVIKTEDGTRLEFNSYGNAARTMLTAFGCLTHKRREWLLKNMQVEHDKLLKETNTTSTQESGAA